MGPVNTGWCSNSAATAVISRLLWSLVLCGDTVLFCGSVYIQEQSSKPTQQSL